MERFRIRTDLALEARESFEGSDTEVHGVEVEEEYDEKRDIRLTRVRILTERGAKEMGKPIGTYLTLEAPGMATRMKTTIGKSRRFWRNVCGN